MAQSEDPGMSGGNSIHAPVMIVEVLEHLALHAGDIVVDATLGMGGHAQAILERIGPQGRLIGLDRDSASLAKASARLAQFKNQCDFIHDDFRNLAQVLDHLKLTHVDKILMDLGISSFQLDDPKRGFAFREAGPLDMRMDQGAQISAFDLINSLSEKDISRILNDFGEERWHKRIARYLVQERLRKPIETTQELSQLVLKAVGFAKRSKFERIHPATRTFQAFRIAVNQELDGLTQGLDQCIDRLKSGGRLAVISFHSGEDAIVKHKFRFWSQEGKVRLIVKKPLRPTEKEIEDNPRSRSARLRIAERI